MASSRTPARRRILLVAAAACGVALIPSPGSAAPSDPATAAEAAQLVAARAHDLEVVSEQVNEAREQLTLRQTAAAQAAQQVTAAEAAATDARQQVRSVARSAYTGGRLSAFESLVTSSSVSQVIDRLAMLDTIGSHRAAVLDTARRATDDAHQARAAADRAAADAQAQVDRVAAQQKSLNDQIAVYQAAYDRLNAEEQRASRAAAERAAQQAAAAANAPAPSSARSATAPAPSRAAAPAPSRAAAAPAPAAAPVAAGSSAAQTAVATALAQVGKPYVWGAVGPGSFDCSGLTQYAYKAAGVSLPHSSSMQSRTGTPVARSALQPGDLVFFYSPVSHVGMYIGNGQMVHASTAGEPVKVASLDSMPNYNSARRIVG
jgi:cell wall-associated NlpC family hydrolase